MKNLNFKENPGRYVMPIKPEQLTAQDIKWLHKICEMNYYGHEAHHIIADVLRKDKQLWRFEGEKLAGLGVTSVEKYPAGTELWIWGIAGKGYVKKFPQILESLISFLPEHNICWISGSTRLPRLRKIYTTAGAKIRGTLFTLNLKEKNHA